MADRDKTGPAGGLVSIDCLYEAGVAELLAKEILPGFGDPRLRSLSRMAQVVPDGYRPGRAPRAILLTELGKAVRSSPLVAQMALGEFLDATAELGRLVRETALKDLPGRLNDLSRQFGTTPVRLWLLADARRGAQRLTKRLAPQQAAAGGGSGTVSAPVPAAAPVPVSTGPARAPGRPAGYGAPARPVGSEAPVTKPAGNPEADLRRRLKSEVAARLKAEKEAARLRRLLDKMRGERDRANREARLKGQENGELRREVRRLEADAARAKAAPPQAPAPIVIETAAALERDTLLETANREVERLGRELAEARRRAEWTEEARLRLQAQNARLRAVIGRKPVGAGPPEGFTLTAPFAYLGPGGALHVAPGFSLTVSQGYVDRHELVEGDIVSVTLAPPARVSLRVQSSRPRETAMGVMKRVTVDGVSEPFWQVVRVVLGDNPGERVGQPLGWVSADEVRRRGLAEGDPVKVVIPVAAEGEGKPLRAPAPGLPALPPVRVVRRFEAEAAAATGREKAATLAGRRRRRAIGTPTTRAVRRLALGRLRPTRLPLAGKKVLVVGGDSWRVNYRRVVEALGGEFLFQSAGDDAAQARAKARAADLVLIETQYVSHKVGNAVKDELARLGRAFVPVNSTGQRALLEALRRSEGGERGSAAS